MASLLFNRKVIWVWFVALLIFPFVLWALPSTIFDESNLVLCPSRLFFDFECFGCGITRAVQHFHHFEFEDAAYYNQLVFIVYPFLIYVWARWTYNAYFFLFKKSKLTPA